MPAKTGHRWFSSRRGDRGTRQHVAVVQAEGFLGLVTAALRDGQACIQAASPDGPVPPADVAAMCGWTPSAEGVLQPSGTCIGYISAASGGERKVHLWPPHAYAAAAWAAACSGAALPDTLPQVSAALRDAGLVNCRAAHRNPGRGRADAVPEVWPFWEVPASALAIRSSGRLPVRRQPAALELGD